VYKKGDQINFEVGSLFSEETLLPYDFNSFGGMFCDSRETEDSSIFSELFLPSSKFSTKISGKLNETSGCEFLCKHAKYTDKQVEHLEWMIEHKYGATL
jgi:hypothetical protein